MGNQMRTAEHSRDLCLNLVWPLLHRLGHQMHPRQQVQRLLQPRGRVQQLGCRGKSKPRETNWQV